MINIHMDGDQKPTVCSVSLRFLSCSPWSVNGVFYQSNIVEVGDSLNLKTHTLT